jgi:hypothetical protein
MDWRQLPVGWSPRALLVWDKSKGTGDNFLRHDLGMRVASLTVLATVKPIGLVRDCLSAVPGTILDPFMGSGTTLRAAFEVLQQLSGAAEQLGISLPGVTRFAPTIDASQPVRQLAFELGSLLKQRNLFLKGQQLVTVNDETGEVLPMNPKRFVGWIEEFCAVRGVRNSASLSPDLAGTILAQDVFRENIRPLEAVHLMRLPVRRQRDVASLHNGSEPEEVAGKVEFLEPGYDERSRIFTVEALKYEMDWPAEKGMAWFREHNVDYPWTWPEDKKVDEHGAALPLELNRSYTVHVAACLGTYCRAMFAAGTPRPMISFIANQPGTGKSTLVVQILMPVYGSAATSKTPKDDDRMSAELETVAQSYKPYVFFDDIGRGLFSTPLNRFILSSSHTGRIYGQNTEAFEVPNVTQVFATGNEIKMSPDLMRRSLVAELFLAGDVTGRKYARRITAQYLARADVRAGFLSACCSLVKAWIEEKQPLFGEPLESFEDWTGTIVGMMMLHPFANPLLAPELPIGGAEDESEMRELLVEVATAAPAPRSIRARRWCVWRVSTGCWSRWSARRMIPRWTRRRTSALGGSCSTGAAVSCGIGSGGSFSSGIVARSAGRPIL